MNNFTFQNPVKLIFGKGSIAKLAKEIPADKKIMVTFGGGSVKKEFWGIETNPKIETLRKAIAQGKAEKVDFLLSVGGGSVLDGTKLIAAGIPYDGDAWELVLDEDKIGEVVPFGDVMTLPATGSEMNAGAVISNLATQEKFAFHHSFPQFSILDPEATFSLPPFQVACGIADTFVHVMEQYLTVTGVSPRSSVKVMWMPLFRNAISRRRFFSTSKSNVTPRSKMPSGLSSLMTSGRKRIVVPVRSVSPMTRRS